MNSLYTKTVRTSSAVSSPLIELANCGGLRLSWRPESGLPLVDVPVRVAVSGHHLFRVWSFVDSGEAAPVWSEPALRLTFFGAERALRIERVGAAGWRAIDEHPRGTATLSVDLNRHGELEFAFAITAGGQPLPVCLAELRLEQLDAGPQGSYLSANPYGGCTFNSGPVAGIQDVGVKFVNGCIGLALPLVYLHDPRTDAGLQFEFMCEGRPEAWLKPGANAGRVDWALQWSTDRLLLPGQTHAYGGPLRLKGFAGRSVAQMRGWRDHAAERYGLTRPRTPEWVRQARVIQFNMNPANTLKGFTRLDDPRCREMLERWRGWGYNTIMAVSQFASGLNWLSPPDYEPAEAVGGAAAEAQCLRWAHDLGFRVFLWVTTVGVDRHSAVAREHPDWFTRRPDGSWLYVWESRPDNGYVGYAPDADPLASGWRAWLKDQVTSVVDRGYDGVYQDGCIPRASNHARWYWPGEGRNSVEPLVAELAAYVASIGPVAALIDEDESLVAQVTTPCTAGRYHAMPPFVQKAHWDIGMGGGPHNDLRAPERIRPEQARDYLLARHASLLPGAASLDILEGYLSEACRPWVVQSILSGMPFKTHSEFLDDAGTIRPWGEADAPVGDERDPACRHAGNAEFLSLVALCAKEPVLFRETPCSIEAVAIEGDAAVVGFLRPGHDRCLLALIQFAGRAATVRVRLNQPTDVPASVRDLAGRPDQQRWCARELLRSTQDVDPAPKGVLAANAPLDVALAAFGFRVFELERS